MARKHTLVLAALLAAAAVIGVLALARTTHVGAAAHTPGTVSKVTIARRSHALDRLEASLRKALAKKPPALPAVPTAGGQPAAAAPQVTYVRPAPIVVSRPGGGGGEREYAEGGRDGGDGGGGLDD